MSKEDQKRVVKSTKSVFLPLGDAHSCPLPLVEKNRENLEATLGPEALILTWKGKKGTEVESIAYTDMTSALLVDMKQELSPIARAAIIATGYMGAGMIGAAMAAMRTFPSYQLLRVKTKGRDYEMFVPQASDWVERLREHGVNTGNKESEIVARGVRGRIAIKPHQ